MKKFIILFVLCLAGSAWSLNAWFPWPNLFSWPTSTSKVDDSAEIAVASYLDNLHNRNCDFSATRMRLAKEICSLTQLAERGNDIYRSPKGECEAYFLNNITKKLSEFSSLSHS